MNISSRSALTLRDFAARVGPGHFSGWPAFWASDLGCAVKEVNAARHGALASRNRCEQLTRTRLGLVGIINLGDGFPKGTITKIHPAPPRPSPTQGFEDAGFDFATPPKRKST
jgi:hypothetical protein